MFDGDAASVHSHSYTVTGINYKARSLWGQDEAGGEPLYRMNHKWEKSDNILPPWKLGFVHLYCCCSEAFVSMLLCKKRCQISFFVLDIHETWSQLSLLDIRNGDSWSFFFSSFFEKKKDFHSRDRCFVLQLQWKPMRDRLTTFPLNMEYPDHLKHSAFK